MNKKFTISFLGLKEIPQQLYDEGLDSTVIKKLVIEKINNKEAVVTVRYNLRDSK